MNCKKNIRCLNNCGLPLITNISAKHVLFYVSLVIHFGWALYVVEGDRIFFIIAVQEYLSTIYSTTGFKWGGKGSYLVTATLMSSIVVHSGRRTLEGVFSGWPQFCGHDWNSFISMAARLLIYGFIMYFTIGFIGEKYAVRQLDIVNVMLISATTYIIGFLVDIFDEMASSIYGICHKYWRK